MVELLDEGKEGEARRGGGIRGERRKREDRAGRGRRDEPCGDEERRREEEESVEFLESHRERIGMDVGGPNETKETQEEIG